MKDLLISITKGLVDNPDAVVVEEIKENEKIQMDIGVNARTDIENAKIHKLKVHKFEKRKV